MTQIFGKHETEDGFESKRADEVSKESIHKEKQSKHETLGHSKRRKKHQGDKEKWLGAKGETGVYGILKTK